MFTQTLDLTTALRPELYPDESRLFTQDAIGLYEGKAKIPNKQNGTVYLTTHRICYVDNDQPRQQSVAINLRDIERYEFYSGFLKSSPKISLWPTESKKSAFQSGTSSSRSASGTPKPHSSSPFERPQPPKPTVTWVCPICSFPNTLPPGFEPTTVHSQTPIPPCQTCGIKPPMTVLLKAAISAAASSSRNNSSLLIESHRQGTPVSHLHGAAGGQPGVQATSQCPRCTFENHPSLSTCEMCGAPLNSRLLAQPNIAETVRPESPGPFLDQNYVMQTDEIEPIKLSFRGGGGKEKIFYERLKAAMTQRKWLLGSAPSAADTQISSQYYGDDNSGNSPGSGSATPDGRRRAVGIAGLERLTLDRRRNNEQVISGAFEDLEALMASAKEITALAESMSRQSGGGNGGGNGGDSAANALVRESFATLGLATTRDGGEAAGVFLSELARTLAEHLTDDAQSVLKKAGGIMALVDLYAAFSRANDGVELVSPADFARAARLWDPLGLPVRLRTFRSGLMVVQGKERTDDKTVAQIAGWLRLFRAVPPADGDADGVPWSWRAFGKGVTAHEAAERFGWSLGVAIEELEMAEERGALCREESIEGTKFWLNLFPAIEREGFNLDAWLADTP